MRELEAVYTERKFARILVEQFGHKEEFAFNVQPFEFERIRVVLEVAGYSVRRLPSNSAVVYATRTEPDLAPVVAA